MNTDDQWWKQQDEEHQQEEIIDLSKRANHLKEEALNVHEGKAHGALGYLAMSLAITEFDAQSKQNTIDHLKAVIEILERKS